MDIMSFLPFSRIIEAFEKPTDEMRKMNPRQVSHPNEHSFKKRCKTSSWCKRESVALADFPMQMPTLLSLCVRMVVPVEIVNAVVQSRAPMLAGWIGRGDRASDARDDRAGYGLAPSSFRPWWVRCCGCDDDSSRCYYTSAFDVPRNGRFCPKAWFRRISEIDCINILAYHWTIMMGERLTNPPVVSLPSPDTWSDPFTEHVKCKLHTFGDRTDGSARAGPRHATSIPVVFDCCSTLVTESSKDTVMAQYKTVVSSWCKLCHPSLPSQIECYFHLGSPTGSAHMWEIITFVTTGDCLTDVREPNFVIYSYC